MNTNSKFISIDPEKLEFHSSCPEGLNDFLLQEIKDSNLKIISENRGGVFYAGKRKDLYRFFLSSRFSSRITFTLQKFNAVDANELYDKAYGIPWERIFLDGYTYKIESMTKDSLGNSRYALLKLKDAIQDRIRDKHGREGEIDRINPDIEIVLRSNRDNVSISISLSPKPMNKRGYRLDTVTAPLRENLAQALIHFSGWDFKNPLIDPMCGSGTILIEAALLLKEKGLINSELLNKSFIFQEMFLEEYEKYSENITRQREAQDSIKKNNLKNVILYGFDIDEEAILKTRKNIERAGVSDYIKIEKRDFLEIENPIASTGYIVTNPPYGQRMGDSQDLKEFYFKIGKKLKNSFSNFIFTIVCGDKSLLGHLRLKADKEKNLSISKLKGKFVTYHIQ